MTINSKEAVGKINSQEEEFSYDKFPYECHPFFYTRPEHLHTIGTLFGMVPPDVQTARILELGCSSGGNIINFAQTYPESYTLGVDLSKIEIEHGIQNVKELALENIELKHLSITDIDESFGKFDYIICHGVFSWVPGPVREKIFEIASKLLAPQGIAFVSYNTLPGWNMVNTTSDMLMFHSSTFTNSYDKLSQAKLFLNFINDALNKSNSPYARFLKQETELLFNQPDYYLLHEYLEGENKQFYFHQFINLAKSYNLNYLGEANIESMYIGNLPAKAAEKLQGINDIIRSEQYMDFIQNKRFRCTLLCRDNIKLSRNININTLKKFYITCNIVPAIAEKEIDLTNSFESISFYLNGAKDTSISTSSPIMKAIFYTYSENIGNPIKLNQLLKMASKKLPKFTVEDYEGELTSNIGRLIFSGYIQLFATRPHSTYEISAKPKVSNLARYQAGRATTNKLWITNQINKVIPLQIHEKYIIELLDGKNDIKTIEQKILDKFIAGEINAQQGNNKITDPVVLEKLVKESINFALERFKANYILIS